MKPLETFQNSIERCSHFITLYDLLHNKRERSVRSDWATRFRSFMGWSPNETFFRIDGEKSMIIIRPTGNLTSDRFDHDYVSELLRAAIVNSVSALDNYMHDLAITNSLKILYRAEDEIPAEFKKLSIPVIETKKAIKKIKENPASRPGHIIKKAIHERLLYQTYQGPKGIENCMALLGIRGVWNLVTPLMPNNSTPEKTKANLLKITNRRNKIVHEADLVQRLEARSFSLRIITRAEAEKSVKFIKEFVVAIDQIATQELS